MMKEAFIYIWFDAVMGKRYIGVHKGSPDDGYVCSSKPMLLEYANRPQDFQRDILYYGTWNDMLIKEQELIMEHGAVKDPMFYNQAHGFGPYHNYAGTKHTEKTKEKMRKSAHIREPRSTETKKKMSEALIGRKLTEEHKAHVSAALMGKKRTPFTEEHRANMSSAQIGNRHAVKH